MSEHQNNHTNIQPQKSVENDIDAQRFVGDVGAIDFDRIRNALKNGFEEASVVYHGLKINHAERRKSWAQARVDRIGRKDALYENLALVRTNEAPTAQHKGETPSHPRGPVERFLDKRMSERQFRQEVRNARRNRVIKAHAGEIRSNSLGWRSRRLTAGSVSQRKKEARSRYKAGNISAEQLRAEYSRIEATPVKYETRSQRASRRAHNRAQNSANRAKSQPISGRWRSWRKKNAEKDVVRHSNRSQKHLNALP